MTLRTLQFVAGLTLAWASNAAAQSGSDLFGYGYILQTPVNVGPGQLLTLIADGSALPQRTITSAPGGADLPMSLGGVSVGFGEGTVSEMAPILEVNSFFGCEPQIGAKGICTAFAAITVQIPFEAYPCAPCSLTGMVVFNNGKQALALNVQGYTDQVHILTGCDSFLNGSVTAPASPAGLPCSSIVTHADGSAVSAKSPAQPGEVVVAYAVGLGQTNPPLQTGKLVTAAAPTQTTYLLDLNFHPNALASKPLPGSPQPIYAGATPGYVGLYQVNFTIPQPPAGTPPCVDPSSVPAGANVVYSNLTVSIGGQSSFDAARICVAVPNQ